MWTGNRPPPAPPSVAPPSVPPPSKYHSARQNELEQLRQRGLAKLLNKHFTAVTLTLAEEKAAADAALRDLEARKAAGLRDWGDVNPGELSVWDKMYLELQQKKADCKRKEKETLLLYQRYVSQFGSTGQVALPSTRPGGASPSPASSPSNANVPVNSSSNGNALTMMNADRQSFASPSSKVPLLAGQIESNLSKHVSTGADRHPSIQTLGIDETYQKSFSNMDQQQRMDFLRSLEGRGVDARTSPSPKLDVKKLPHSSTNGLPNAPNLYGSAPGLYGSQNPRAEWEITPSKSQVTATTSSTYYGESPQHSGSLQYTMEEGQDEDGDEDDEDGEDDDDDDLKSIVSALTSTCSLITYDAEARLVQFIKTETEAIRQMLDDEEHSIISGRTSYSSEIGSQSGKAADQAEQLVHQMQKILQSFQPDPNDEPVGVSREPRPLETFNPNEQWMVYWNEHYQREYYHEVNSNTTQWTKPETTGSIDSVPVADFTATSRNAGPLSHYEVIPESHGGRNSRRDTYRKLNRRRRNRRRILYASVALTVISAGVYVKRQHPQVLEKTFNAENLEAVLLHVVDKKSVEGIMKHAKQYLPDPVAGEAKRKAQKEAEAKAKTGAGTAREGVERKTKNEAEIKTKELPDAVSREERERKAKKAARARKMKEERERKAREEAEHQESERIAREAAERMAREEAERAVRMEAERQALEEARLEAERLASVASTMIVKRPWACNIPLSYLISKTCRTLATTKPVFNLKEIVDAMMQ